MPYGRGKGAERPKEPHRRCPQRAGDDNIPPTHQTPARPQHAPKLTPCTSQQPPSVARGQTRQTADNSRIPFHQVNRQHPPELAILARADFAGTRAKTTAYRGPIRGNVWHRPSPTDWRPTGRDPGQMWPAMRTSSGINTQHAGVQVVSMRTCGR